MYTNLNATIHRGVAVKQGTGRSGMDKLLEEKIVLITGGAQGLGYAMARGCSHNGATVIMADQ